MQPLVSVIVPVYKVEAYLDRCVESIVNQTYKNLEIILVDDGSPDNCPQMCDAWAQHDSRIKVIHKTNAGMGYARNDGLDSSMGEFIMFVDSDDYLSPNAVQVLYERMIIDNSDLAVGKHVDVCENGYINDRFCSWMKDDIVSPEDMLKYLGEERYISVVVWAKLYRRHIFAELRFPSYKSTEDLWVFPYVVDSCNKISVVCDTIYYYFQRPTSIMHTKKEEQILDDISAELHVIKYLIDRKFYKSARKLYSCVIDNGIKICNKNALRRLNKKYLNYRERGLLLKEMKFKNQCKWILMQFPFSNCLFVTWLKIKGQR